MVYSHWPKMLQWMSIVCKKWLSNTLVSTIKFLVLVNVFEPLQIGTTLILVFCILQDSTQHSSARSMRVEFVCEQVENMCTCSWWRVGFSDNFMWKVKLFIWASWNVIRASGYLWHSSGLTSGPKFLCWTLILTTWKPMSGWYSDNFVPFFGEKKYGSLCPNIISFPRSLTFLFLETVVVVVAVGVAAGDRNRFQMNLRTPLTLGICLWE